MISTRMTDPSGMTTGPSGNSRPSVMTRILGILFAPCVFVLPLPSRRGRHRRCLVDCGLTRSRDPPPGLASPSDLSPTGRGKDSHRHDDFTQRLAVLQGGDGVGAAGKRKVLRHVRLDRALSIQREQLLGIPAALVRMFLLEA